MAKVHRLVEFTLEDLELLLDHESVQVSETGRNILSLYRDLKFTKSYITSVQESSNHQPIFSFFAMGIEEVVHNLFKATESYLLSDIFKGNEVPDMAGFLHYSQEVADLVSDIKSFEGEIFDVHIDCSSSEGGNSSGENSSSQNASVSSVIEEKIVVDFEKEHKKLLDRLIGRREQLEVIPIIGMAGIGKTTLANTLYNHPLIIYHFHIRAWTSVSQSYREKTLLKNIMSSIVNENDPVLFMSEDDIGEKLYKLLMGNRYLIVIDDMWDVEAWNDLERYFPKNENGSRILITSRNLDVAFNIAPNSAPYFLKLLTEDQSWDLFKRKVFANKSFPEDLMDIRREIVAKCKGLPLKIVVLAGLLAQGEKTERWWRQVAENIGFFAMRSEEVVHNLFKATESYLLSDIFKGDEVPDMAGFLHYSQEVAALVRDIKSFEDEIFDVHIDCSSSEGGNSSGENSSSQNASVSSVIEEKIVVGFENEQKELLDRLIGGRKQLEVIPITGMAGIGKTTLANTLYNHPLIIYHFHIRAYASVSQSYRKKTLLKNIMSSIVNENDPVLFMSEDDIGEKLYKLLMGNRYLIVMDDMWDFEAWNDLERYFPKNENGSRILITSRNEDVALNIRPNSAPYFLNFLTEDQSWDLFKRKVFANKSFPEDLMDIGREIVAKCKGLPLAIVVLAGLLAQGEKTERWWRQVAENIGFFVNSSSNQFQNTLELSYTHLPSHLKSCFLYLGSYPEDYEIPVTMLIKSWIAEGFISPVAEKRLEDVAEGHLINLINRNLVMVAKRKSNGGIKSCNMHDLLRDLCLRKALEKKFVQQICNCRPTGSSFDRQLDFSDCQYFHFFNSHFVFKKFVFNRETLTVYKLLRTLDLRHIILDTFPESIMNLSHLRCLAICVDHIEDIDIMNISELWRLETFIVNGEKGRRVTLNTDIMKVVGLRHLEISQELVCEEEWGNLSGQGNFRQLQTISQLSPSGSFKSLLCRAPNLRKLGFYLSFSERTEPFFFPELPRLDQLVTLKFEYRTLGMVPFSIPHQNVFPSSLKQLTLIGSHANWEEMSILGLLPNLEVLRIKENFFSGPRWETSNDGFRRLKFLKLSHIDLQEWVSCCSHFPVLEDLVLNGCLSLEEIPSDMGESATLQTIKVYRSSESAVESALAIQETQKDLGNEELKIFIYPDFQEY